MRVSNLLFAAVLAAALWLWIKPAAAAVGGGNSISGGTSAAERNNNPLNIRVSNTPWKGKVAHTSGQDHRFEAFSSWVMGIRAGIVNMHTWYTRGKNTLRALIYTWAPPSDGNETGSYVDFVASRSGIDPDTLFLWNKNTVRKIFKEMAHMEAAHPTVSDADFDAAWKLTSNA